MSVNISDGFGITIDETTFTKKFEAPTTTLNWTIIILGILSLIIIIFFIKSLIDELKDIM